LQYNCFATKPNRRTILSHVLQLDSAGKEVADICEVQAHHCMVLEQTTWLLCSVCCTGKQTVSARNK